MNPSIHSVHAGPHRKVELKSQRILTLPGQIAQQSTMAAMFSGKASELQKLLPSPRLKLVELYPGTSLLCVACTEHTRVDGLEPYLELSLLVPVRYEPRLPVPFLPLVAPRLFQNAGYYVHRTLVSTAEAAELGAELRGARTTVADIRIDEQPFWRRAIVSVEGQHLLTLDVRKSRGRNVAMTTYTYTLLEGQILRTPVPLAGELGLRRGAGAAKLVLGDHYITHELRALKLGREPLLATYAPAVQSVLAAPDRALVP